MRNSQVDTHKYSFMSGKKRESVQRNLSCPARPPFLLELYVLYECTICFCVNDGCLLLPYNISQFESSPKPTTFEMDQRIKARREIHIELLYEHWRH